jgi:hypothetical protein
VSAVKNPPSTSIEHVASSPEYQRVTLEFDEGPHEIVKGGQINIKVKIVNYTDQTIYISADGLKPNNKFFQKAFLNINEDARVDSHKDRSLEIILYDQKLLPNIGVHEILFNLKYKGTNDARENMAEGTTKVKIKPTTRTMIWNCIIGGMIGSAIIVLTNAVKQTNKLPDPLQTSFTIALGVAFAVAAVFIYENTQGKDPIKDVIIERDKSWITIGILVSLSANGLKTIFTSS